MSCTISSILALVALLTLTEPTHGVPFILLRGCQ